MIIASNKLIPLEVNYILEVSNNISSLKTEKKEDMERLDEKRLTRPKSP